MYKVAIDFLLLVLRFGALIAEKSHFMGLHLAEAFFSIGPNLNSLFAHADLHDSIADESFL